MARRHVLKLTELRSIRARFAGLLIVMAGVTLLLLSYLGIRVYIRPERIEYLDFFSLCFYGLASLALTIAQVVLFRNLSVGAGRRIDHITHTDDLTGLGNRRHTARFLAEELREAQLSRNPLSVLVMDLDDFKLINDTHGHLAGDLVLRAVGHSLKTTLREADFAGRVGGDEFVVILPDTDSQCASVVAHRIAEQLSIISITLNRAVIRGISASIGISAYPANANTRAGLLADADRTMYAAKKSDKGSIAVSIARAAGPEPRASVGQITTFETQIEQMLDRTRRAVSSDRSDPVDHADE